MCLNYFITGFVKRILIIFFGILCSINLSIAAEIEVQSLPGSDLALVMIKGEINFRDDVDFMIKVINTKKAIVMLDSPGGNVDAALGMGKIIRSNHFATMVGKPLCASACALVWLAGAHRYATLESKIGFHAAYIGNGNYAAETGLGNALIGSYLARLGLSDSAVAYITASGPTSMTWLSVQDANRLGIEAFIMQDGKFQTTADPVVNPSANARGAVTAFSSRIRSAGMFGVIESSKNCYLKLNAKPTKIGLEFCYVFDTAAKIFDDEITSSLKTPSNSYFETQLVDARLFEAAKRSKKYLQLASKHRREWQVMAKTLLQDPKISP